MKINNTYRAYEMTKTAINMTRKMHWQIVRALFYSQTFLLVLVFGMFLSNMSPTDQFLLFDALYTPKFEITLDGRLDLLSQMWIARGARWILLISFSIYFGWPLLIRFFQRKARYDLDRKTLRGCLGHFERLEEQRHGLGALV